MKCTKCKKEIFGFALCIHYFFEDNQIILCEKCFRIFFIDVKKNLLKMIDAISDWLHLNEDLIIKFNKDKY